MKRTNHLFDRIPTRENLRLAVVNALRGKRHRCDAREFTGELEKNLARMAVEIDRGTVEVGRFRQFTIYDPKRRTISAPCFEERVLHHAIMNVCGEVLDRSLIFHSYACRSGKGREACLRQAVKNSRRFEWFLKMDIAKYFDSISQDRLLALLVRRFKENRLLNLFDRIVRAFENTPGRGLPIGSLISQHFANFFLSPIDRLITERSQSQGYVRYMDDMVVWGDSAAELTKTLKRVSAVLEQDLALALKHTPFINRTRHGISMLGCRVYPEHIKLDHRSRTRYRKKLTQYIADFTDNRINELEFQQRATALTAFTKGAGVCSWRFRTSVLDQLEKQILPTP